MVRGLLAAGIGSPGVDRDRDPLESLATSAREQGKAAEVLAVRTDLTSDTAADEITRATRARFGHVDILVNNAGIGPGAIRPDSWQRPLKFWEVTADQWRPFLAVHATAPFMLANAVVPEMMRQGWGRIVNVTTSLGTMLNAGSPTYGPSKAALEALSAIMAKDLDGSGVTVNVLVPGGVTNTPMVSDEAGFERAKMIQPEVMAPPLVWLVSDAAGKVTGRRFLAVHWGTGLAPEQAAEKAGAPVAWTSIATMPIQPGPRSRSGEQALLSHQLPRSSLWCLQRTAVDNDGLAGAEAGLHQIEVGFGDILRLADPADREAGADTLECRQSLGFRQSMPKLGVDRACAHPVDPDRPQFGGEALHHALNPAQNAGIYSPSRRGALPGKAGDQGDRARLADMRIGRADGVELTPEPHFEGRACLFVGKLHDLLAQQRIADRHRQVIERTEAGKEPLQHRLVGNIDAFAACVIAEPSERAAQFLGRMRGDRDPCTLR